MRSRPHDLIVIKYSPVAVGALVLLALSYPVLAQQGLAVTVQVDAPQKKPGDAVAISGRVTSSGVGVPGALVGVTVTGPDGNPIVARSVSTSQDGSYTVDPFLLSNSTVGGAYTATATTSFQGQGATASTSFTIVSTVVARRCLIATAAFGSPINPEVTLLREFRDYDLMGSRPGAAFMSAFNSWYYSYSPSVSEIIQGDELLRAGLRIFLYPLVGVLTVSKAWFEAARVLGADVSALIAGVMGAALTGSIYLSLPAAFLRRSSKGAFTTPRSFRCFGILATASSLFVFVPLDLVSGLSAAVLVLTVAISSAVFTSRILTGLLVGPGRSILLSRD